MPGDRLSQFRKDSRRCVYEYTCAFSYSGAALGDIVSSLAPLTRSHIIIIIAGLRRTYMPHFKPRPKFRFKANGRMTVISRNVMYTCL